MRWLLFLSRLAFISGFCILIHVSITIFGQWINEENILSTIIVIGYFIGAVVIPVTMLCYLGVWIVKRRVPVPYWLIISNFIFLLAILLFILLNIDQDAQNIPAP